MTDTPAPNEMPDEIYLEEDDGKFHIHEADSDIALNPACQKYITKYIRADLTSPEAVGGEALNWKRQKDTVFAWAAEHGFTPVESEIVDLLSAIQQPPAPAAKEAAWKEREKVLEGLLEEMILNFYIPEANCSCHKSPPCNDCVEYSYVREIKEQVKAALQNKGE